MTIQKLKLSHVIFLLLAMTALHFIANLTGLYKQPIIWIDKVLHVMAGIAIAMLWFWFLQRKDKLSDNIPKVILVSSAIGSVLLVAFLWEVFEFAFWKGLPEYANNLNLYSPTIFDVLSDIGSNLIGAIVFSWFAIKKTKI
ncbi:MAG: hypothetical protein EXS46_03170 [Candidatus Taylorbacteria bacterium]|nr:hypothetical protein [Candidatus Taylorbacteria bacterium]